MKGTSY